MLYTCIYYHAEKCSTLPENLTNSSLLKYSYTSNGENLTIRFWCEEGYKLIGQNIFTCNITYQWSLDLEDLKCLGQGKYSKSCSPLHTIIIPSFYTTENSEVLILGSAGGIVFAMIVVTLLIVLLTKIFKSKNVLPTALH